LFRRARRRLKIVGWQAIKARREEKRGTIASLPLKVLYEFFWDRVVVKSRINWPFILLYLCPRGDVPVHVRHQYTDMIGDKLGKAMADIVAHHGC
jgi:hypothetical protein